MPSFENVMKLGDGAELVSIYDDLHGLSELPENPAMLRDAIMYKVQLAARVIQSCCSDNLSHLLVDIVDRVGKLKIKLGAGDRLKPEEQIIIAAGLARHGIAGVSKKPRKANGKAADSVDLWEFVHTAMAHLDMSKADALSLTMTEFVRIMETKYPPESSVHDEISDEAYDNAMARLQAANAVRDKK